VPGPDSCSAAKPGPDLHRLDRTSLRLAHPFDHLVGAGEHSTHNAMATAAFPAVQLFVGAAQAHFDRSIGLARAQGALAWELRTAMSIASLQRKRHRTEQARQVLQAAYECFTEGFETADLKRAKQLLDELGGARRTADRPSVS
jgi:hypothetical protein